MGKKYFVEMEIDDAELNSIFQELEEAKDKIASCTQRLEVMGFLKIKTKTDSSLSDESANH